MILGIWGFGILNALGAAAVVIGLSVALKHLPLAQQRGWREVRA